MTECLIVVMIAGYATNVAATNQLTGYFGVLSPSIGCAIGLWGEQPVHKSDMFLN